MHYLPLGFPDFVVIRSGAGAVVSGFGLGIGLFPLLIHKRYHLTIRKFKHIIMQSEPTEPLEPTETAETVFITTEVAIVAAVAVACIIGAAVFWTLRKRK